MWTEGDRRSVRRGKILLQEFETSTAVNREGVEKILQGGGQLRLSDALPMLFPSPSSGKIKMPIETQLEWCQAPKPLTKHFPGWKLHDLGSPGAGYGRRVRPKGHSKKIRPQQRICTRPSLGQGQSYRPCKGVAIDSTGCPSILVQLPPTPSSSPLALSSLQATPTHRTSSRLTFFCSLFLLCSVSIRYIRYCPVSIRELWKEGKGRNSLRLLRYTVTCRQS